ncbi:MAG: TetR/AcrR family transcriptional regulator [Hyphomicrobium sp.]|jgi:TetR/AcrR family transcriptional repressor of nem operon
MPRVSKKQAEANHGAVIAAAARLFKARGINGVSLPALMAEAGLTHGAFYGHFKSKDDLAVAACEHAFAEKGALYDDICTRHQGDKRAALSEFVDRYTAKTHRDQPALGCPVAALADDASREEFKGPVRKAFAAGLENMVQGVLGMLGGRGRGKLRDDALADVALLVGALVLARATKGQPISEEVLHAARKAILTD